MHPVILGAGPAGLSCANALLSFGLHPIVIEPSAEIGGAQRANFHPNLWLLGAPPEESGREMTARIAQHFATQPIAIYRATTLLSLGGTPGQFELELHTPDIAEERLTLLAAALVIATGSRPRSTPDFAELARRCPSVHIGALDEAGRDRYHGVRILILGGGDNALDHARLLAEQGCQVDVLTRGRFTARPHFLAEATRLSSIHLFEHTALDTLTYAAQAPATPLHASFARHTPTYAAVLVLWGYQPNSEIIESFAPPLQPQRLANGHIDTDRWQRTSVPFIYAAGDVTDTPQPSVAVAVAQGLTAARAIERDLNAR